MPRAAAAPVVHRFPRGCTVPLSTEFVRHISRLDPMPLTAQRLMRALQDEQVGPAQLAGYVQFDPAMASGILRAANSAAYEGAATANLREAIVRLGTSKLVELVLGDTLKRMKVQVPMYGLGENDLWRHSAAASLGVAALRLERPSAGVPESASIAALLHDIGKLVMARYLQADLSAILELCRDRKLAFVEAERELLGCDPPRSGQRSAANGVFRTRSRTLSSVIINAKLSIRRPRSTPWSSAISWRRPSAPDSAPKDSTWQPTANRRIAWD